MSKIFEALHKGGNHAEQLIPPLDIEFDPRSQSATEEASSSVEAILPPKSADAPALEPGGNPFDFGLAHLRAASGTPILPFEESSAAGEQYRALRTKIVQHPRHPQVILISSAGPGDGKSVTAINLAGALSLKNDGAILLVDGDLRRPSIATQLSLAEGPGFAGVLAGAATLEQAIVRTAQYPNLYVLQAGQTDRNPAELLDAVIWKTTVGRMKQMFKFVVMDSPPIGTLADYDLLAAVADGIIAVVRPDHTKRQSLMKALAVIPETKRLGIVINCVSDWFLARHQGYSPYGNAYYR